MNDDSKYDQTPGVVPWPRAIDDSGRFGIAGDFVRMVEPHTEADPNAILLVFLTYCGNLMGRNFCVMAGADAHFANLFCCLIGNTGHGRKGSAIAAVESFFGTRYSAPPAPKLGHVLKGISSGEAIVYEIHDDIWRYTHNKTTGKFEQVLAEPNVEEKRLMITLPEFQQCLANMRRGESILPSILRTAWDKGDLSTPSKSSRATATGAHVSLVTAISREELLEQTSITDAENGTLNRFIFACCRRSQLLPQGGKFFKLTRSEQWANLQAQLNRNLDMLGEEPPIQMQRNVEADEIWGLNESPQRGMYMALNVQRVGLWGAITARAPQMVLRLSTIIAAINGRHDIHKEHLDAAAEIWRYCDESTRYIFGDRMDDQTAIAINKALRAVAPNGLTRTQIHKLWANHMQSNEINRALLWLSKSGIARCEKTDTGGRPLETWFAC